VCKTISNGCSLTLNITRVSWSTEISDCCSGDDFLLGWLASDADALVVAEVKVVVAYVATGSPADAAEQGHTGCTQQDLAVGTAGADTPHPLGQVPATAATGGTMPAGQVLPATPSLAALEDAT